MQKVIKIGNIPLKNISQNDLIEVCKIEGVHLFLEYEGKKIWGEPTITDFCNTMFSDTVFIDYLQKRISDGLEGKVIVFFFNYKKFNFHWHFKDSDKTQQSSNLRIESIKYLIFKGYDIPLYTT